ncbi:hypothetical protein E2C01_058497 [Portunus trituberculatus]|uniref:Uncharacterized protein n=1 Tax=Portunus trituberculatus TaxID=210409 RepID=A0A5B7H2T6_PORTR|nr:hypothetical protein [Portunus trituberculatus]
MMAAPAVSSHSAMKSSHLAALTPDWMNNEVLTGLMRLASGVVLWVERVVTLASSSPSGSVCVRQWSPPR